MTAKTLPEAGVGAGTTLATSLVGVLSGFSGLVPEAYREVYNHVIPYISPFLSWVLIWIYNRFVEPPEMAGIKGKLKRDLRMLKKGKRNKHMSAQARIKAQDDYDETWSKLANLGRDFYAGVYSKTTP